MPSTVLTFCIIGYFYPVSPDGTADMGFFSVSSGSHKEPDAFLQEGDVAMPTIQIESKSCGVL